jgi:hypothetical protein
MLEKIFGKYLNEIEELRKKVSELENENIKLKEYQVLAQELEERVKELEGITQKIENERERTNYYREKSEQLEARIKNLKRGIKDFKNKQNQEVKSLIKEIRELEEMLGRTILEGRSLIGYLLTHNIKPIENPENPEFSIIYHHDVDGTTSASLICQYLREKGEDRIAIIPQNLHTSLRDWKELLETLSNSKQIFILDLGFSPGYLEIPGGNATFISDKKPRAKTKGLKIVYDESSCTAETTYRFLKKDNFKGKNAERIVEMGKMGDGIIRPDEEVKRLGTFLQVNPKVSRNVVQELGEKGSIMDEKLWRAIDECYYLFSHVKNYIMKNFRTVNNDSSYIIVEFPPISVCENYILSSLREITRKNVIGIVKDHKTAHFLIKMKRGETETIEKIKEYCELNNLDCYFHHSSGHIDVPRKYYEKVLEDLKAICF